MVVAWKTKMIGVGIWRLMSLSRVEKERTSEGVGFEGFTSSNWVESREKDVLFWAAAMEELMELGKSSTKYSYVWEGNASGTFRMHNY